MVQKQTHIHPVPGYILVKPEKREKTTSSGIVLPDTAEDKPQQGQVLSVGEAIFDDGQKINPPCGVGDTVIYREWGGKEYKDGQDELLILKFEDIMAIIK